MDRSGSNWRVGSGQVVTRPMSALGQKRTSKCLHQMSALPPKADMDQHGRDVRFVPKAVTGIGSNPNIVLGCKLAVLVPRIQHAAGLDQQ